MLRASCSVPSPSQLSDFHIFYCFSPAPPSATGYFGLQKMCVDFFFKKSKQHCFKPVADGGSGEKDLKLSVNELKKFTKIYVFVTCIKNYGGYEGQDVKFL